MSTWRGAPTGSRNRTSGSDWIWHPTRCAIYLRDGDRCIACDARKGLSLDHVIPRSRGGSNRPDNLITLCTRCNSERYLRPIAEWRPDLVATVRRQLRRPIDRAAGRARSIEVRPQRVQAQLARRGRDPDWGLNYVVEGVPF